MVKIGIIGLGYWGPHWLRNIAAIDECELRYGCDLSAERCKKFRAMYPGTTFTQKTEDLWNDPELDAVIIATPTSSHYALAKEALNAAKHVLVEKPMTSNAKQAAELVALAKKKKKLLMVDHTFAYTEAVAEIKRRKKDVGSLLYFDSSRLNLGIIQKDTSVFFDLAVHDLTILAAIEDLKNVKEVFATGEACFGKTIEMGHIHLRFVSGFSAHIHVSWLSPVKIRKTLIAGRKAMIEFNDIEPSEKIRVYDRGVDRDDTKPDPFYPKYRSGDVLVPGLHLKEALETEARHFIACIEGTEKPLITGEDGRMMIRILELAEESCAKNKPIAVKGL